MLFNCNDYFTSAIIILKPKQTVRIKQNYKLIPPPKLFIMT